jgi:hypothetical protein
MTDIYTIERSTSINARPELIYARIADFHRWTEWSPWEDLDPDLQRTYAGSESGTGAIYTWSGNRKAGEGRMEITEASEASKIQIALRFLKPFKLSSITIFELKQDGETTQVTWTMSGPRTTILKVIDFFRSMDQMIGPDLEKGLERLKAVSESSGS